jgi:methylated-DNA-protein-cysteine methyltransferase related protein
MSGEEGFAQRVQSMVRRVPYGRVLSYGDVAALLGRPRAARGVGRALAGLGEGSDVPWWRIVNGRGCISLPGPAGRLQRLLLAQEGVSFRGRECLDLRTYRWAGPGPASADRTARSRW